MREGDERAVAALFRGHFAMLYDYGMKLSHREELVKDCIQDIFAYMWQKRRGLAEVESVPAYLLTVFRRHLLKSLARQHRQMASQQQFGLHQDLEQFSPEDLLVMQESNLEEKQIIAKGLRGIPPRIREALYLKTYAGLSYGEIAAIMNVSPQVARNYVSEAFHRLRQVFAHSKQPLPR